MSHGQPSLEKVIQLFQILNYKAGISIKRIKIWFSVKNISELLFIKKSNKQNSHAENNCFKYYLNTFKIVYRLQLLSYKYNVFIKMSET